MRADLSVLNEVRIRRSYQFGWTTIRPLLWLRGWGWHERVAGVTRGPTLSGVRRHEAQGLRNVPRFRSRSECSTRSNMRRASRARFRFGCGTFSANSARLRVHESAPVRTAAQAFPPFHSRVGSVAFGTCARQAALSRAAGSSLLFLEPRGSTPSHPIAGRALRAERYALLLPARKDGDHTATGPEQAPVELERDAEVFSHICLAPLVEISAPATSRNSNAREIMLARARSISGIPYTNLTSLTSGDFRWCPGMGRQSHPIASPTILTAAKRRSKIETSG